MVVSNGKRKRKSIIESIFPREYDFEDMLVTQAQLTAKGVRSLMEWLGNEQIIAPTELDRQEQELDKFRHDMEDKLSQAFSTPFDRQEIYGLSRQMDYIMNYSVETAKEIFAFGVEPDYHMKMMVQSLLKGTEEVVEGVRMLSSKEGDFEGKVRRIRGFLHEIEATYITAMVELFKLNDPSLMLKRLEIYHHLRDAGRALRATVDVLHRMKVDII
ncbi:MAG: DUF47 family protein [Methanomassiliicoccales archaeon]